MKKLLIFSFIFFSVSSTLKSQETQKDTTIFKKKVEISFGQSLLFVSYSQSLNALNQAAVVIPTTSILLFAVFRPMKRLHIPVFFNIPTESKQYLINGVLVNERANPTLGTGVELKLAGFKLAPKTRIEFEMAALGSWILTKNDKILFAPIGAARFRIIQNNNAVMYLGSSYSVGINAWGLIYGTGFIF